MTKPAPNYTTYFKELPLARLHLMEAGYVERTMALEQKLFEPSQILWRS